MDKKLLANAKKFMRSFYGKNEVITGDYDKGLSVKCHNGTFIGLKNGDVISYKGIPFALPPIEDRRWKAPVAAPESDVVRQAYYFAKSPIQTEVYSEHGSLYKKSEDCLYLNVWLNSKNKSTNKTVMVFIHGGSYGWGATSDPLYEGTNFVNKFDDVILVTIAYRTGIMGFIDLSDVPGGEEFPDSCNAGLLDQIEALKWVKRNIGSFGGDKDNVTIFGESAGGGSVSLLPVMPLARGLFKRVIAESGSVALSYSKDQCKPLTQRLLAETGKENMKQLMAMSERAIKKANLKLNDFNNFPMRDGRIVPEHLYGAYEYGGASQYDMIIGTNSDECRYWIGELGSEAIYRFSTPVMFENNRRDISEDDNDLIDKFLEQQGDKEDIWKITEFYNELLFRVPAAVQAGHHAACGGNTYMYYWTYPSALKNRGACHAVELAYVFNNLDRTIYTGNNIDPELADKVQNMWVNFARTGNPTIDGYEWPKYDIVNRTTMLIGSEIKPIVNFMRDQFDLVAPLMKYKFNGSYADLDFHTPHVKKVMTGAIFGIILSIGILALIVFLIIKFFNLI